MTEKEYHILVGHDFDFYYDARMTVCKLERLIDSKFFYYINFVQEFKENFNNASSYLQIIKALNTIRKRYSDLPIILTGTFNVYDHYILLCKHLDVEKFHICDFLKHTNSSDTSQRNCTG